MSIVGSVQTLADYALKSAGEEQLAVIDSVAEVAAIVGGALPSGDDKAAVEEIAAQAKLTAECMRGAETMEMQFLELIKGSPTK